MTGSVSTRARHVYVNTKRPPHLMHDSHLHLFGLILLQFQNQTKDTTGKNWWWVYVERIFIKLLNLNVSSKLNQTAFWFVFDMFIEINLFLSLKVFNLSLWSSSVFIEQLICWNKWKIKAKGMSWFDWKYRVGQELEESKRLKMYLFSDTIVV